MDERAENEEQHRAALARMARGDETALEELYAALAPAVFAFVVARMSDRESAEEVAADTWLGCWRSAGSFRGDSRVLTWLLGIAKRQISMNVRRKRVAVVPLEDSACEIADDAQGPEELALVGAGIEEIVAALDGLPTDLSETIRLAWLHEMPYAEIALLTEVPVGTVKSRVSRARRLLQESFRRQA